MKAYRDANGGVRIFRPDMNMRRMNRSAESLMFPVCDYLVVLKQRADLRLRKAFDPDEMTELIKKLIEVDQRWVPSQEGYSLCECAFRSTLDQRLTTRPQTFVRP